MKNISYGQILELSFNKTKTFLLNPFSMKRCLKLMFIAFAAAQLMGGGSIKDIFDFSGFVRSEMETLVAAEDESEAGSEENLKKESVNFSDQLRGNVQGFWTRHRHDQRFWVLSGAGVLAVMSLILLFVWTISRFQFVWLHALVTGDVVVKKPFYGYEKEGHSVFVFKILFNTCAIAFTGAAAAALFIVLSPLFNAQRITDSMGQNISFGIVTGVFILVVLVTILASTVFLFYINHLVIPIMALEHIKITEAWKKFKSLFSANLSDMFLMPLIFLGLSVITGILSMFAIFLIGVVGVLVAGLLGSIFHFVFYFLLSVQYAGSIMLLILGMAWLGFIFFATITSLMPFVMFLRYFTLYFLASLDPVYQWETTDSKHQIVNNSQ